MLSVNTPSLKRDSDLDGSADDGGNRSDSQQRRNSLRRVSLKFAEEELSHRQSNTSPSEDCYSLLADSRSSFSAAGGGRVSRDSWNFSSYEGNPPLNDKIIGFDELVETLNTTYEVLGSVTTSLEIVRSALMETLVRFCPKLGELERYALFDFSKPYTRNCIAHTDKYSLLLLCWNPSAESRIHDHPCDACILTVLEGILREERFPSTVEGQSGLKPTKTNFYMEGQCSYMTDEVGLHRIKNPNATHPAISLHLYYPPFSCCSAWSQSAVDGTVGKPEKVSIGTFSFRGRRTPQAEGRLSTHGQVMLELLQQRAQRD